MNANRRTSASRSSGAGSKSSSSGAGAKCGSTAYGPPPPRPSHPFLHGREHVYAIGGLAVGGLASLRRVGCSAETDDSGPCRVGLCNLWAWIFHGALAYAVSRPLKRAERVRMALRTLVGAHAARMAPLSGIDSSDEIATPPIKRAAVSLVKRRRAAGFLPPLARGEGNGRTQRRLHANSQTPRAPCNQYSLHQEQKNTPRRWR